MKKFLLIFGFILLAFLGIIVALPIIYKDEIKVAIEEELASSVNADVYFDSQQFGFTLFKNFPNITASLGDFGVVGRDQFEGIPLLDVKSFEIELDTWSMITSGQSKINGIELVEPRIYVMILDDGSANYDILESDSTSEQSVDEGAFSAGIEHWQITNGSLVYDDDAQHLLTRLIGINHSGSGNISENIFDIKSTTSVDTVTVIYEGISYIGSKRIEIDMVMNMDLNKSIYTFKENTVKINDFALGFDGFIAMPDNNIDLNIKFAAKDTKFKRLLSLVPGVFLEGYEDIKSAGDIAFKGFVKGPITETIMPAYHLDVHVKDAMFQYPDLPSPVTNINLDAVVDNKDGVIDNTFIDIKAFRMDMGKNPIDGKMKIANLRNFPILADISAKLNLAELSQALPIEGAELKGLFDLNVKADGVYDSIEGLMPKLEVSMVLRDGFLKSTDFPIPLEKIEMTASINNETGNFEDATLAISKLHMLMDGEEMQGTLLLRDLNNYTWDMHLNGSLDLEKLTSIYPIENTELKGRVRADIETKGSMRDLDENRYDQLPTAGTLDISDLHYMSPDLPQGLVISKAKATLNPQKIVIDNYKGVMGKSDVAIDGSLTNYMAYLLHDKEVLVGKMNLASTKFDTNEWMESEEEVTDSIEADYQVVQLPENINFIVNSSFQTLLYDNLVLKNANGQLIIRNGVMTMSKLKFNTLDGDFVVNGSYDPRDILHPTYDMDIDIKNLSISRSYEAFNVVQQLAPIAKVVNGNFSTDMKVSGELGQDMMPDMNTVSASGLVEIVQATLRDSKMLTGINSLTQLNGTSQQATLKDIVMKMEIENGQLKVAPFDVKLAGYDAVVSGGSSLDGAIAYSMKLDVPASDLGSGIGSKIASLINNDGNAVVTLPIKITGTMTDPKFKLGASEAAKSTTKAAKDIVVSKAKVELDSVKNEATEIAKESLKDALLGGTTADSTKVDPKDAAKELQKKAKDKLKKLFGGG